MHELCSCSSANIWHLSCAEKREVTIETLLCIRRSVLGATALNSFSVWGSILSFSFTVIAGSICDNVRKG